VRTPQRQRQPAQQLGFTFGEQNTPVLSVRGLRIAQSGYSPTFHVRRINVDRSCRFDRGQIVLADLGAHTFCGSIAQAAGSH
jgi:hypothetical protein